MGGPQDGSAGGGLQLGLVELIVAAHDGHERLVVAHVDEGLELLLGRDPVRLLRERLDGDDARSRELLRVRARSRGSESVRRLDLGLRLLGIRRVPAILAGDDEVLARVGHHHELDRAAPAHRARVRFHLDRGEAAALEDPRVREAVRLERLVEPALVDVEGVAVLHGELPHAEQAALRPRLVAELGLDLVPGLGKLPVAAHLGAGEDGEDLLVGHGQAHVRALAILEAEHVLAHHRPAAALFPDLARIEGRQVELLPADPVHLLAHHPGDLVDRSLAQRKDAVDAGGELAHESGAHQQLVARHRRVSGVLF